jgi:hypothetical protein
LQPLYAMALTNGSRQLVTAAKLSEPVPTHLQPSCGDVGYRERVITATRSSLLPLSIASVPSVTPLMLEVYELGYSSIRA